MKLKKLEAGRYKTENKRFLIMDLYCSSGRPGFNNGITSKSNRWLIEDLSGNKPFRNCLGNPSPLTRRYTLADAKEVVQQVYTIEQEEKSLLEKGWSKIENKDKPGRCWILLGLNAPLTRKEALLV